MTPGYFTKQYINALVKEKIISIMIAENIIAKLEKDLYEYYKKGFYEGKGSKE